MKPYKVVIETPAGSTEKYDYDKKSGFFLMKKIMPKGMAFPYDFGFLPNTKGDDGDPLDVLVFSEFKTFPGCLLKCQVIGALLAEQTSNGRTIRNDRYFAIPTLSRRFAEIKSIKEFLKEELTEIVNFFINYNLSEGVDFNPIKMVGPSEATKLHKKAIVLSK